MVKTKPQRKPVVTEADVTRQVRQYLKLEGFVHWKQHQGLGSTPGIPDIIGVLPNGRMLAIEVKRPGGKLSPHQVRWTETLRINNALVIIAYSLDDVILAMEAAHIPTRQRSLF